MQESETTGPELPGPSETLLRIAEATHAYKGSGKLLAYGHEFARLRDESMTILEIGVKAGGSVRLWTQFFPRAKVVGLDIKKRDLVNKSRITLIQGDQSDAVLLEEIAAEHGPFGLIIDDGSHIPAHQILSFEVLFPHLLSGGLYVCEDVHTSMTKFKDQPSAVEYFSRFVKRLMIGAGHSDDLQTELSRDVSRVVFFSRGLLIEKLKGGPKYRSQSQAVDERSPSAD